MYDGKAMGYAEAILTIAAKYADVRAGGDDDCEKSYTSLLGAE